jgi:hypothetical protein
VLVERTHPASLLAARLTAQLLAGTPARDPVDVAERIFAIQGQDPRGARLAVRARSEGLTAADVDRELTEERSLVITWLNRGTLHLVRSEDYPLLHTLTTPQLAAGSRRRLAQEGVPPDHADKAIATIERALAADGPLNRYQLRDRVEAVGVRAKGQALVHILYAASLRGLIVRGPMVDGKHAYVLAEDWLGKTKPLDRDAALAEFARRYLAGHGPATDRDLAKWAGMPLRDARAGLAAIGDELEAWPARGPAAAGRPGSDALVLLRGGPAGDPADLPPPRLLGVFEPALLGWASRAEMLGEHDRDVVAGGIFRPVALVKGRVQGLWSVKSGEVAIEPLGRISKTDLAALEDDAADVKRFLG